MQVLQGTGREQWLFPASCAGGTEEPGLEQGSGGLLGAPRLCHTPEQQIPPAHKPQAGPAGTTVFLMSFNSDRGEGAAPQSMGWAPGSLCCRPGALPREALPAEDAHGRGCGVERHPMMPQDRYPPPRGFMGGSSEREEVPATHSHLPCSPVAEPCCAQEWELVLSRSARNPCECLVATRAYRYREGRADRTWEETHPPPSSQN